MELVFLPQLNELLKGLGYPAQDAEALAEQGIPLIHPDLLYIGGHSYTYSNDSTPHRDPESCQTDHSWRYYGIYHPVTGVFDIKIATFRGPWSGNGEALARIKVRYCQGEDSLDNDEWQRHGDDWEVFNVTFPFVSEEHFARMVMAYTTLFFTSFDPAIYYKPE